MKKIFTFAALLAMASSAFAQMAMTFTGIDGVSTKNLSNGCTLIELPVGTDMTSVMAKATFTVDGTSVDASQIVPNPSTLSLTDGKEVTFLYKGKAYGFKFSEGKYFTAVFLSDPHMEQGSDHDGTSTSDMQNYVSRIVAMGKSGGAIFSFDALPGYVPSCDIAFSTGDMDADSKTDDNDFNTAHAGFATAGIPFVTMCGNHDLVPDYWTGDDGDKGLTYGLKSGGSYANDIALATVETYRKALSNYGISDVETITDGTSHTQFNPFSFTFNGVRFYVGQTYWFQKPYDKPEFLSSAEYYAPDGVISALETFVGKHTGEASVWMQHYPFVAGSDCDRWWLDQSDVGRYIKTSDTSVYGTSDDVAKYTEATAQAVAKTKKDKLAEIINKTQNPVHFSGHTHTFSVYEYNGIKDYTTAASGYTAGAAYIVLMKAGKGVVEVKQVQFNSEVMAGVTNTEQTIYPTDANAVAVNLQTALKAQGVDISTATSTLEAATDQNSVSNAVSAMSSAFNTYINNKGTDVDVTAMLGTNTGFETAQGTADASLTNVYPQTGWNEYVESFSNSTNAQYIKLQQNTDVKASGSNSLYLRAKWQDRPGKVQVMKQTALPAGVYELGYQGASVGTLTSDLNYVEVGGKRTQLPMPTSSTLVAKNVTLTLDEPSVVTLSFGFTGGQGGTESAVYVDDITLTYKVPLTPGTDMTSYISNATFTGGTETKTVQGSGGQVVVPAEWTFQYSYSGWNDTFVSDGVFNAWAGTISRAELSQTLSLPDGAYRLTADVKTDKEAESSSLSIYGAASNNLIGRSEEIGKGNGDFNTYSCAFDVTDGTVTIGIRSDNAYYQVKNLKLTYLGETAEAETDASYLRQDYYWNGRNSLEFDASGDKYKNATGVVVYPAEKNQLIKAASTSQFANTDNKIVNGVCQRLVIADKNPFTTSSDFTATEAVFDRSFSKGIYSTVCLPFAPSTAKGVFYRLDRDESDNTTIQTQTAPVRRASSSSATLYFEEESNPQCNFPYVYIAKEDGQIEASNVKVEATPSTMESSHTSAGYYMQGVYEKTSVSDIYGFNTKGELLTASTANMTPFRAFIKSSDTTITTVMANFRDSSTGIEGVTGNADSLCDVFATSGELLRSGVSASSALDGLEQGIYIVKQGTQANKVLKK